MKARGRGKLLGVQILSQSRLLPESTATDAGTERTASLAPALEFQGAPLVPLPPVLDLRSSPSEGHSVFVGSVAAQDLCSVVIIL